MEKYTPPFTITNQMLNLVSSIMEKIGKLENYSNLNKMPVLRKNNRINSIHSSLAIEASSLTFWKKECRVKVRLLFIKTLQLPHC